MTKPLTVLFVGEAQSAAQAMLGKLKKAGYKPAFEEARTPTQLRRALKNATLDVIISAYSLPKLDGPTALKILQETGLDIPFIVVEEMMGEAAAVEMLKAGASDCIPFDNLQRLVPVVERELMRAAERRQGKKIEEDLRESENRYQLVFENSGTANTIFDKDCRVILQNSMSQKFSPVGNAVGKTALEVFGPKQGPIVTKRMRRVLSIGVPEVFETQFTSDVNSRWVRSSYQPLLNDQGVLMGVQVVSQDISDRKKAEEKLKENEERFRSLYENATIGMYRTSPKGQILMANPALVKMLGYESIEELSVRDLRSEGYEPIYPRLEFQNRIEQEGQVRGLESAWKRRDNSLIFIRESARLVRDDKNQPLYYEGTVEDITERKKAEEALRQSEEKFRLSFMTGLDAFYWSTLEDGKIIEVNPVFEQVWGFTREEVIGRTSLELGLYEDPDDRAKMISQLKEKGNIKDMELKGIRKDGRSITISLSGNIMTIDNQGYILGVIRDITNRKRAEQQREILYQLLRSVSGKLDAELVARAAVETIVRLTGYPHVCIALQDESRTHWSVRGAAGRLAAELGATYPIHKGVIGNAFKTGKTQWVRDVLLDPHYVNDVKAPGGPALRSEYVALMRRGEDQLGALNVESDHPDAFDDDDARMIQSAADIISLALQNARLFRDAQDELTQRTQSQTLQDALYRIATAADTTKSLEDLYPKIHQIIASVMPAENFYITLYDEPQNLLRFPYFKDAEDEPFMGGIQPARGLSAYVLRTGKSLLCTQAVHDELERLGEVKLLGVASAIWLGVPLIVESKTIGAMVVQHYTDPQAYGEREQHMLEFVSTQVGIAINRKQKEEEIQQLNASLEKRVEERTHELRLAQEKIVRQEKLALLGQLAGGVGHELRNPLGIISNAIYYLKFIQPEADEKVRQYHAMIEQEVHNSEKIITDLLDFARLESMEKEPVAVSELVQRTLARFPVPEVIHTTLNIGENLPKVYIDVRQMEQVLGNLTVNACQAMLSPRGTRPLPPASGGVKRGELTISAINRKGMVAIAVKDTGTGITPENMEKLFEPLFTTKSKGIGLGLAVSRKLAEANGGRIEVKSMPGKGSTFTLFLPEEPR